METEDEPLMQQTPSPASAPRSTLGPASVFARRAAWIAVAVWGCLGFAPATCAQASPATTRPANPLPFFEGTRAVILDGLSPCAPGDRSYGTAFRTALDGIRGRVLAAFTSYPSCTAEWGVRLLEIDGGYVLRVVEFHFPVLGEPLETQPHRFERSGHAVMLDRVEREVAIDAAFAARLRDTLAAEIARATPEPEGLMGFDGETYEFTVDGACATTWSPEPETRAHRLVATFDLLAWQARMPTRPAQLVVQSVATGYLRTLQATSPPSTTETLAMFAAAVVVFAFLALPLFIAAGFALVPRRLPRPAAFTVVCAALGYGTAALALVALLPLGWALLVLAAGREDAALYFILHDAWLLLPAITLVVWLYASVRWPMRLRTTWPRFDRPAAAP